MGKVRLANNFQVKYSNFRLLDKPVSSSALSKDTSIYIFLFCIFFLFNNLSLVGHI